MEQQRAFLFQAIETLQRIGIPYRDCISVWKLQHGALDLGYLQHWAEHLGVTDLLARVQAG
jgi:hypothetical protein